MALNLPTVVSTVLALSYFLAAWIILDRWLAPTTPCVAPIVGQEQMVIAGSEIRVREYLGCFTRPFSFIGWPVLSVPLQRQDALPAGVQIVAAPFKKAQVERQLVLRNSSMRSEPRTQE